MLILTYFVTATLIFKAIVVSSQHSNISELKSESVNNSANSTKRISVQKCEEYSRLVVDILTIIPLVVNPTPVNIRFSKCGSFTPLIVGGESTRAGEFPHMAAIGWRDEFTNEIAFKCGGSVISDRYIITTAHCLSPIEHGPNIVRLGDHNLYSTADGALPQNYDIEKAIVHPSYFRSKRYNDIGLLQLRPIIIFNQFVRPACLGQINSGSPLKAIATGWGREQFFGSESKVLTKVELNIISNNECRQFIGVHRRRLPQGVIASQMCAGVLKGGKDTCQGDSGGPLQISTDGDCIFHILGLTSFGKFCAGVNSPGVYTRISFYLDWIESVVWT